MKYTLKKELIKNAHKTLPAGTVMDVTQEYAQWLDDNGYGEEKKKAIRELPNILGNIISLIALVAILYGL